MIYLYTFPLWSPILMLVWFTIGIQHERESLPDVLRAILSFITFFGLLFDIFMQYTVANLYFWEINPVHEFTISMRIGRLMSDPGWRGNIARRLAWLLNAIAPVRHI